MKNITKYLLFLQIPILLITACVQKNSDKSKYHRKVPYPESDLIASFEWTSGPYRYPGSGSDMHWWTWGIDDAIYTVEDDGKNFGRKDWYAHVLKVTGIPPNHTVETATDFDTIDFRTQIPNNCYGVMYAARWLLTRLCMCAFTTTTGILFQNH